MKKSIVLIIGLWLSVGTIFAQKVGYVNTETIFNQIPEYVTATEQLKKLSEQYKSAIESETAKIDAAYQLYQSERARMTEAVKQARENEIIEMERTVKEKQKAYFGEDGVMSKKSEELMTPIKDRVEKAIKHVAEERGYTLILDVSALQGVVYKNDAADLSLEVIKKLN